MTSPTKTNNWNSSDLEIARALNDRWEWLDHQAEGSPASKRSAWRDLGDAGLAEDRVRQSYTGRYTIELLQNAHDACADDRISGAVWFVVTDSALLVGNQGVAFTANRVISLARLGSSEKARLGKRSQLIGYKGIGFTAVFEISDRPQVISSNVAFCFDREEALRRVSARLGKSEGNETVPARYFPLPLDPDLWRDDAEAVANLFAEGAVTVVRLPFRDTCSPAQVIEDLRSGVTPEFLLFAPALSKYEMRWKGELKWWKRTKGRGVGKGTLQHLLSSDGKRRSWVVRSGTVAVTGPEIADLRDELWKNVRLLNVGIALPWTPQGLDKEPPAQNLFAYFPTSDRLGRGILIHGDFYLDDARRRIAANGPQSVISSRVASAAVELVVDLVESLVGEGNRLLCSLAPVDRPDGYGEDLAKVLDAGLARAKLARPADNGRPTQAGRLRRLATKMALPKERMLLSMLSTRADLVLPGDDRGRAEALLTRLGCEPLQPAELATRIDPATRRLPYVATLTLLEMWMKSLEPYTFSVLNCIKKQPVVQDTVGYWRVPTDVVARDEKTPPLPSFLARPEVQIPDSRAASAFIARLAIGQMTPELALSRLIEHLTGGDRLSDSQNRSALDFAWKLWAVQQKCFDREPNLGAIPVPVRNEAACKSQGWARADSVYLSAIWTGGSELEALYGPFGRREFLAEDPPLIDSEIIEKRRFFQMIGVADHPRMIALRQSLGHFADWCSLPSVAAARQCPDNHPYTTRRVEGLVIDRLDELIAWAEQAPSRGRTLARGLLSLKQPYGPDATIRCAHSSHSHARGNRAIGYQRWRLEEAAWVPVKGHPSGARLALPSEAWSNIPKSGHRLVLARATLSSEEAKRLELIDAESASRGAMERALHLLNAAHPNLQDAGNEIRETAEWLARRLDQSPHGKQPVMKRPPLPAITSSGYSWREQPAVNDLPGMPAFPDVALLPPGRWASLRRAYELPLASSLVSHEVVVGQRIRVPPLMTNEHRAELLALLVRIGNPRNAIAHRLALLRIHDTSSLAVKWRSRRGGDEVINEARFHLAEQRDNANRLVGAMLYRVGGLTMDHVSLGRVIANYLDVPEAEHTIAIYLSNREDVIEQQGVVEEEIAEAKEALRKRGLFGEAEPAEDTSRTSPHSGASEVQPKPAEAVPSNAGEESNPEDTNLSKGGSPVGGTVAPKYLEPDGVRFGAPRKVEAVRAQRRQAGSRGSSATATTMPNTGAADAPVANATVEQLAMRIASCYGTGVLHASSVRDVHMANLGWDLEFHFSEGHWQPVEVKGSSGQAPFIITRNEWRAAREHNNYMLIHVINVAFPSLSALRVFRGLGQRLTERHMKSLSWVVDGWSELEPEEIPIEPLGDRG